MNTVISLYYYLRVIAPSVLQPAPAAVRLAPAGAPLGAALLVATVLTVAVGIGAEPLLELAGDATALSGG